MLPNWDWTALQGMSTCMYRKRRWTSFTWVSSSLGLDNGCCEHCTTQSIAITIGGFAIQLGQHQAISSQLLLKSIHIQPSTKQHSWILPSIFNLDSDLLLGRHVNNSICKASVHYKTPTRLGNQQKQQRQKTGKLDESQLSSQAWNCTCLFCGCKLCHIEKVWLKNKHDEASFS